MLADMMFRIGIARRRDRAVLALLVCRMVHHGPAGVVRLLRNAGRVLARRGEHPAGADWWHEALTDAGFIEVDIHLLEDEGGIATARAPA